MFLSSVGDLALDVPDCNVIIQISSHFGARRQEAQRLGRILRPSEGKQAVLYEVITADTTEVSAAERRRDRVRERE